MSSSSLRQQVAVEALQSWENNADYWNAGVGREGNKYWKVLQEPCLSRLIGPHLDKPGCQALDLATGNGLCARWMASRGAQVLATDGSNRMLQHAASQSDDSIRFVKVDVTNPSDLSEIVASHLPDGGFDVVLMNMAMMDVATIEPLAKALPDLLKKDGVFVATLLHPAYWTNNASRNIDITFNPVTGGKEVVLSRLVKDYLHIPPVKGIALPGQPEPQIYFHRPLHEIFGTFFKNGLVMDALEEPAFTKADFDEKRVEASSNYTQIPAHLAFRMRRAS